MKLTLILMTALLAVPSLALAQFAPEVTTSFSSLDAGDVADLDQEITFFDGDENFSSLYLTFDIGTFDFDSFEVDDEIGALEYSVTITLSTPAGIVVTRTGTVTCEVIVTEVDTDTLVAEVIAVEVDDVFLDTTGTTSGDDIIDEVCFDLVVSATDLSLELTDTEVLPSAQDLKADVDVAWKLESGYTHDTAGGTLTTTSLFTSIDGSESETEETFDLIGGGNTFLRGDVDGNGSVSALLDALAVLDWAFAGGEAPLCMDAADVDDSGTVSALLDALRLLNWAFAGGDAPPDPGTETCGTDPDGDDCEEDICL